VSGPPGEIPGGPLQKKSGPVPGTIELNETTRLNKTNELNETTERPNVIHTSKKFLALAAAVMLLSAPVHAAETQTVQVATSVDAVLQLGVSVIKMPEEQLTGGSSLNFGELSSDALYGPMRAATYFKIVLYPNASSRPYRVTQSSTAPSNGTVSLPAGACIITPWSINANGQAQPAGSSIAGRQSFVQNNLQLYSSDPQGKSTSIVSTYAITNDPNAGAYEYIPYDQAGGAYSSQAIFSLELL
jgi:hypothetical protein